MKKKQGKLAKYLTSHFKKRCDERVGELLPRKEIERNIRNRIFTDTLFFVSKLSNTRTKYGYIFKGVLYHLIYDKLRHKLVTVIPN